MISVTETKAHTDRSSNPDVSPGNRGRTALILLLLLVVALVLRLDNLTERTFGHPENFISGLTVPDWVRFPPPRTDLEGLYRGTLIDGHPPGYFAAMLPWVKVFGSSLTALRLPSVILGVLSVLLLYFVSRKETDRWTALLAATLLALNGHHIFWSQQARMYVAAAALGLASSLLLWKVLEEGRKTHHVAYFAVTTAMLWTQLYCWPLLLAQMVWATLHAMQNGRRPVALKTQIAAVIAGSPVIQLSLYQNPPTQWKQSALEYFGFGYAFYSESLFFGETHSFASLSLPVSILGIALIAVAVRAQHRPAPVAAREIPRARVHAFSPDLLAIAAFATALLVAFPLFAPPSRTGRMVLLALAVLPAMLLAVLAITNRVWTATATRAAGWKWLRLLPQSLSIWLALLPWAVMFTLSVIRPSFVARGALIFVPYLLIVLAMGIRALGRARFVMPAALVAVVVLHVGSVIYFRNVESSGRDYRTLADGLKEQLQPTDIILVRNRFTHPPLLYYLPAHLRQVVPLEAVRSGGLDPDRRVWVIDFEEPADSNLYNLVRNRPRQGTVEAFGGRAALFAPVPE